MYFFSKRHVYPECGMFTIGHLVYIAVLFGLIALGLYMSRNATEKGIRKQTLIIAIVTTVLENVKILYNLLNGYTHVGYWVPLSFCALFLYCTWLSLCHNKVIAKMAQVWMVSGGIFGGLCFLFYPSTALPEVQFFHFVSTYAMGYHALMVYLGLLYFIRGYVVPTKENFKYYAGFMGVMFSLMAIIDYSFGVNFMFLYEAYALPAFIQDIANWCRPIYSITIALVHIVVPYTCMFGLGCLFYGKNTMVNVEINPTEELTPVEIK